MDKRGFCQPRYADDEAMATGKKTCEQVVDDGLLAHDPFFKLRPYFRDCLPDFRDQTVISDGLVHAFPLLSVDDFLGLGNFLYLDLHLEIKI